MADMIKFCCETCRQEFERLRPRFCSQTCRNLHASNTARKLSDEEVAAIRAGSGKLAPIAERHGISVSQASKIRKGRLYKTTRDGAPVETPTTSCVSTSTPTRE